MGVSKVASAIAIALGAVSGCSSDSSDDGAGGAGGSGGGSTACKPTAESCYFAGPEGPGNECLAKADFTGQDKTQLRVTQHAAAKPATLAQPYIQDTVMTKKSLLKQLECFQDGLAQFNFLVEIDKAQKSVTLGGGVPQALIGEPTVGTCWADFVDPTSGLEVKPTSAAYTETAEGAIEAHFPRFIMPIYLEDKTNADSYVLVPLNQMTFSAKLSADNNCIGRFAYETLDYDTSLCKPAQGQFAWENGGKYEGYITVEEADKVMVVSLGQTLCVVLSGDTKYWKGPDPDLNCATSKGFQETGGLPKGDWCSTTNSEGGCVDSWRLSIDIAASAIKIGGAWDGTGCGL